MKLIKTFDQIATENKDGKYIALGNNGKKYDASYSSQFGCMFFCIPQTVKVVGYIKN